MTRITFLCSGHTEIVETYDQKHISSLQSYEMRKIVLLETHFFSPVIRNEENRMTGNEFLSPGHKSKTKIEVEYVGF